MVNVLRSIISILVEMGTVTRPLVTIWNVVMPSVHAQNNFLSTVEHSASQM